MACASAAARGEGGPCPGASEPRLRAWAAQLAEDPLFAFAAAHLGAPVGCEGAIESREGEPRVGRLTVRFPADAALSVRTFPPEASLLELAARGGLPDPAAARRALEAHAAATGLEIDWSAGTERREGELRVVSFEDPRPGLNAGAELAWRGDALVAMRVRLAP